jgi:MFS family permease
MLRSAQHERQMTLEKSWLSNSLACYKPHESAKLGPPSTKLMSIASSPDPYLRSNFHHLYADVFWYGILAGSTLAFIAVYAAHIGANSFQIGLLTGGGAIVNLLGSLPAGRWLENRLPSRAVFQTATWRVCYALIVPLTWFLPATLQTPALIALIIAIAIPSTPLSIAFNSTFAHIVPPEWRAQVVGRRNALLAISVGLSSLLCGQVLDRIRFPSNYEIVFGIGSLGAMLSAYHLRHLRMAAEATPLSPKHALRESDSGWTRLRDNLRHIGSLRFHRFFSGSLLRLDLLQSPFGFFLAAFFLFYTFQYVPIPLFPLVWVQRLHLSDGEISLGYTLTYATMLISSLGLRWMSNRYGHRRVLIVGALLFSLQPLLNGLARDVTLFWIASLITGLVLAPTNGGLVNRLMERVPENDRPAHMTLHNVALNLGMLSGSLLGPALGNWLGLQEALLLSAGLRVLSGILLGLWG